MWLSPFLDAADAKKFHEHLRCFGCVTVAELDGVIFPAFQAFAPIGSLVAVFNVFGFGRNLREKFAVQIQMENRWPRHGFIFSFFRHALQTDGNCVFLVPHSCAPARYYLFSL